MVIQPLQYTNIWLNGKQIRALVDSDAEMPIVNSNQILQSLQNDERVNIQIISAFGDKIVTDLKTLPISLKSNTPGFPFCNVSVLFSFTDKLVPCIINTNDL